MTTLTAEDENFIVSDYSFDRKVFGQLVKGAG